MVDHRAIGGISAYGAYGCILVLLPVGCFRSVDAASQTISDTYWISGQPLQNTDAEPLEPQKLCEEFKLALFTHLQSMASLLAVEKKQILRCIFQCCEPRQFTIFLQSLEGVCLVIEKLRYPLP